MSGLVRVTVSSRARLVEVTNDLRDALGDRGFDVVSHGPAELPGGAVDSEMTEVVIDLRDGQSVADLRDAVTEWEERNAADGPTGVILPAVGEIDDEDD